MAVVTQNQKYQQFKALHERPGLFVIPNPWDAGSSRILTALGFEALATTSAGFAFSIGRKDGPVNVTHDEMLANAKAIVDASDLPVSADMENGYGDSPKDCADMVRRAVGVGLAGGSIEDATGNAEDPIYPFDVAVQHIEAAAQASHSLGFVLTARCENFLHGRPDLNGTIRRLQAYARAGADVVYAPLLPDIETIRRICGSVDKPVNVIQGLRGLSYSLAELEAAGVKRVSVGGSLACAALGGFIRAAREVKEHGTFSYAADALPHADAMAYMVGVNT